MQKFFTFFCLIIVWSLLSNFSIRDSEVIPTSSKSKTVPKEDTHRHTAHCLEFSLENKEFNFGTIPNYEQIRLKYFAKNNCNQPIVIRNANTSCGCDVPYPPREPIMPNQIAEFGYTYDSRRIGPSIKAMNVWFEIGDSLIRNTFFMKVLVEESLPKENGQTKNWEKPFRD